MVRKTLLAAALAWTVLLAQRPAGAGTADALTVKDIMGMANKPNGIYDNLRQDLKDDNPSWKDVQKEAKDLATLIDGLRKATPPRGDKDSWDRLTKAYSDNAKALVQATAKMDLDAARAAQAKIGESCMTCHKVHKPPE